MWRHITPETELRYEAEGGEQPKTDTVRSLVRLEPVRERAPWGGAIASLVTPELHTSDFRVMTNAPIGPFLSTSAAWSDHIGAATCSGRWPAKE